MYHIKKDKRSKQSCERIYHSLRQCMQTTQFTDITIKEVVEKAEVARATFYRNFDHLEDVLHYEVDRRFEDLYHYLKNYYSTEPTYFLSFFITPFLKYWYADSSIIELLMESKQLSILRDAFEKLLLRGINDYHGEEPVQINHLNYFLSLRSGIAINVLTEWIKSDKNKKPEEIIVILHELMNSSFNQELFRQKK